MLKATAGGGGRGIRSCATLYDLRAAFDSAQRGGSDRIRRWHALHGGVRRAARATSKCRWRPIGTARARRSACATARCSASTRRSSKKARHRVCGTSFCEPCARAPSGCLKQVGYVGVATCEYLVTPDGQLLLPRGQPAAAGRARRDGAAHRVRSRKDPDPHRAGRTLAGAVSAEQRGAAIEVRLCAEDPRRGVRAEPGPHRAHGPARRARHSRRRRESRAGTEHSVRVRLDDRQDPRARRDARRKRARAWFARCSMRASSSRAA